MATIAAFKVPSVQNEPNKHYARGSPEREALFSVLTALKERDAKEIPLMINGAERKTSENHTQVDPSCHARIVAKYSLASPDDVSAAIKSALTAKDSWENLPFSHRAAIFLKAADLISGKYRYELMSATMISQGKNVWQAEIDAAAELCDFLRFNVKYAEELYAQQPGHNSPGVWNRIEYRALEGFVYAVSPFNFTAIGGNLPCAPALMGNVVLWKPSPYAILSNYVLYQILLEAGLPPSVIQFVPGDAEMVTRVVLEHQDFASLHFTGSTAVFRSLYGKISAGITEGKYRGYPRIVAETGGKNFHLVHRSADIRNAVVNTVRGAFEYQGQKCSAASRAYIPSSLWSTFKEGLVQETEKLGMGEPADFEAFIGPVIHENSFKKLTKVIDDAKNDPDLEILTGGTYNSEKGYFIRPTIYLAKSATHPLFSAELFGPILVIYVYDDNGSEDTKNEEKPFKEICKAIDSTSSYGLTGAVFAKERSVIRFAEDRLRHTAGNFYINGKCTGAVVGQQPFGGARASGTNDKAGSMTLLGRFVSMRSIKEDLVPVDQVLYRSNQ